MVGVGNRMEAWQLKLIANALVTDFPVCSVDDFSLAFQRGAKGMYGKLYGIDMAVIYGWVTSYMEEKAIARERQLAIEKGKERSNIVDDNAEYPALSPDTQKLVDDYLKTLKDSSSKMRIPSLDQETIKEWGQEKPPKKVASSAGHIYTSQEAIIEYNLKQEWMRSCFDFRTGDPLPSYVSFEEFKLMKSE